MNFVKSALLSAATLGALATFSIGSVSADQTSSTSTTTSATASSAESASGNTSANFNLTQGGGTTTPDTNPKTDKGALSLTSVPDGLDFGSHAIGDLQTSGEMNLSGIGNSNLTVQDYRGYGANKTWKVSAQLSQFAPQSGDTKKTIDATLNANFDQAGGATGISSQGAQTVFESTGTNATNGVGTKTATLDTNGTNLTIAQTSRQYLQAANYTGTVTWTLTNTAN